MTSPALRAYAASSVTTASPARMLTMLYDRLCMDLLQGEQAIRNGEPEAANRQLTHAQDIIFELQSSLDVSLWPGGAGLMQIYTFLLTELSVANVRKDAERVASCRSIVEPLRDAWHVAAVSAQGASE